jgi:putative toxin-antitoxin system antitoxin component (TIGR02293 family)
LECIIYPIGNLKDSVKTMKTAHRAIPRPRKRRPAEAAAGFDFRKPGASIGARYDNFLQAMELIRSGLPVGALLQLHRTSGLTLDRIKQLARISAGSLSRRKQAGQFSQEESERLLRISRLFERAAGLYDGDADGARQWLETPIPALGNRRPLELAETEPGAREVEDLIGRIEHGIPS